MEDWILIREAAAMRNRSTQAVYELIKKGRIRMKEIDRPDMSRLRVKHVFRPDVETFQNEKPGPRPSREHG